MRAVFLCVENSNRSQMAEAFARIAGIEAFSAGSRPSGKLNPKAIESMREIGYDLSTHESKSVDELPDLPFDFAVTMCCGDLCPTLKAARREDWEIPDSKNIEPNQFRLVRDMIREKVHALVS